MGIYINPENMTKEQWLDKYATPAKNIDIDALADDETFLVWVDNGAFTALAVIPDDAELQSFLDPNDRRLKMVWIAKKADVETVSG